MVQPQPAPPPAGSPWAVVAAVLIGVWTVGVTVLCQALGWLADQVLLISGLGTPAWAWPVVAVINAVLVGSPALILALVPRSPAVRAAGRAWLIGAGALGGLGLLRAIPAAQN